MDGTLSGGIWTNGATFYDGAVDFDGTSSAMLVPGSEVAPPRRVGALAFGSLSIRFRFANTGTGDVIPLFYFGVARTDQPNISLILEIGHGGGPANRKLYFTIFNTNFCFDTGINLVPGAWYQFVGVVGTNGNTGYLNGSELTGRHYNLNSNSSFTNFFSSVPAQECLTIGYGRFSQDPSFTYAAATISDVRIFNRPLTGVEIAQLYEDVDDGASLYFVPVLARGRGVSLSWPSTSNYTYSVVGASSPAATTWDPVQGWQDLVPTPPINSVSLPSDTSGNRFYRLRATHSPWNQALSAGSH